MNLIFHDQRKQARKMISMNIFLMPLFLEPPRVSLTPAFVHPSVSMGTCIQSSPNHQPSGSHRKVERKFSAHVSLYFVPVWAPSFTKSLTKTTSVLTSNLFLQRGSNQPCMTGGSREEGGCADPRGWRHASEPIPGLPARNNHPAPQNEILRPYSHFYSSYNNRALTPGIVRICLIILELV